MGGGWEGKEPPKGGKAGHLGTFHSALEGGFAPQPLSSPTLLPPRAAPRHRAAVAARPPAALNDPPSLETSLSPHPQREALQSRDQVLPTLAF